MSEDKVPGNVRGSERELMRKDIPKDVKIVRQAAGKAAAEIVSGILASGESVNEMADEDIIEELEKWSERFKEMVHSGTWKDTDSAEFKKGSEADY